jgi:hypothetical protein
MLDKARLGTRYTCYNCGCRFYDLNRPEPACPDCNANQKEAPLRDVKALLGKGKLRPRDGEEEAGLEEEEEEGGVEEDDDIDGDADGADDEEEAGEEGEEW